MKAQKAHVITNAQAGGLPVTRRRFLGSVGAAAASGVALGRAGGMLAGQPADAIVPRPYAGPNVVIVRFGGGVRRRETIDPTHTYAPYLRKELARRGALFTNMTIDQFADVNTSHGEGTLYILTGKYEKFQDVGGKFLGARFESKVPTIFEYLRKHYQIADHEALIVNGEDRTDEEFYSFSNHHLFGAAFRSRTLSLYRFKVFLLERQIAEGKFSGSELEKKRKDLAKMKALDYRAEEKASNTEIDAFWARWRDFYGETGFVNPRGDRLLTELTLWSMRHLRPRLVMVNYNDPDYVHWGNMSHYTKGISVIDEGLKQLVSFTDHDEFYSGNTVYVIVPDCGRDTNPFVSVPCQHHFGSRSSHEIWTLAFGPGIEAGAVVDRPVDQTAVSATVGQIMNFGTPFSEGSVLEEAIA